MRKLSILLLLTLAAAVPASAYVYSFDCRGPVVWPSTSVTFNPSLISFPYGSGWNASIEAARIAWNDHTPGTRYRINYVWTNYSAKNNSDGVNSIYIASPAEWTYPSNYGAVTTKARTMC